MSKWRELLDELVAADLKDQRAEASREMRAEVERIESVTEYRLLTDRLATAEAALAAHHAAMPVDLDRQLTCDFCKRALVRR